jgi:serine/threonine protein kinase
MADYPPIIAPVVEKAASTIYSFTFDREVRSTSSVVIYKAKHNPTNTYVAVKKFICDKDVPGTVKAKNIKRRRDTEYNTLKMLQGHQSIPQVYESFDDDDACYLVMEWIDGRNLPREIRSLANKNQTLSQDCVSQIISSIDWCHSHNVTHGDVKVQNFMLTSNNVIKLIDFECSFIGEKVCKQGASFGTPNYIPPELINNTSMFRVTKAIDLWSLGVTLYVIYSRGVAPFSSTSTTSTFANITKYIDGQLREHVHISQEQHKLINQLIKKNPSDRKDTTFILSQL